MEDWRMISKKEKVELRTQLLGREKQLLKEVQSVEESLAFLEQSRPAELAEESQEAAAAITLKALDDRERQELDSIKRALVKLDNDTYGICEKCMTAIPVVRLSAFPSTALCIACEKARESELGGFDRKGVAS
jgi:DnaK suppressor protein